MATIDKYVIQLDVQGQQAVDRLKNSLSGLGAAVAGIGFASFIAGAFKAADAIGDVADATGIAVGQVGALADSLKLAGGDVKDVGKLLTTFYGNLEQAANGSEKAQDALGKVGIKLSDLTKLSEGQLLTNALQSLSEMDAGAQRTAAGVELFGKAFRNIDPTKLQAILDTKDVTKFQQEYEKAGQVMDNLEANFATLQKAVIGVFTPLIGETDNFKLSLEQAQTIVKTLGALFATMFAVKTVSTIMDMVTVIRSLTTALKGTVIVQTALTALSGPRGWAIIAGGAAAAAAAVYGLNKALEGTNDEMQQATGSTPGTPAPASKPAFGKVNQLTKEELKTQKQLLTTTKEQTTTMKEQNALALRYQQIIISNLGVVKDEADYISSNAKLQQDAGNKVLDLDKQIAIEKDKGRTSSAAVVAELEKQKSIVNSQLIAQKDLLKIEYDRQNVLKQIATDKSSAFNKAALTDEIDLMNIRVDQIKLYGDELRKNQVLTDATYSSAAKIRDLQKQATGLVNLGDTDKQTQMATAIYDYYQKSLQTQFDIAEGKRSEIQATEDLISVTQQYYALVAPSQTAELANIFNLIDLENKRAAAKIKNMNDIIAAEKKLQQDSAEGAKRAIEDIGKSFTPFNMAQQATNSLFSNMNSAIDNFVTNGTGKFSDFARSVVQDLAKMALKAQANKMLSGIFGGIGDWFGGLFAEGGTPPVGKPSIVGEKGPELFVPKSAGTIIPNNKIAAMGSSSESAVANAAQGNTYITNNISAIDAKSVAQLFAENRKTLFGSVQMAQKEMSYSR